MESRKFETKSEPEIVYSRSVKAGKRIYYLDVKKARNDDLYLCMTESKRRQGSEEEPPQFEKHKLFLYKEDFSHFMDGLNDVIGYIREQLGDIEDREEWTPRDTDNQVESAAEEEEENEEKTTKRGLFGFIKR